MHVPKYRKHSTRNRAFVEWRGVRYPLGEYNSDESHRAYRKFLRDYVYADEQPTSATPAAEITVGEVTIHFLDDFAENNSTAYRSRYQNLKTVCHKLQQSAGDERAIDFGPRRLKAFREKLIDGGLLLNKEGQPRDKPSSRKFCNEQVQMVVQVFKWAAEEELLPGEVYKSLEAVQPLRRGKTRAKENEPTRPVAWDTVKETVRELHAPVCDMVMVQWYTGCRSQSLCHATLEQFDTSGEIWMWTPKHKTEHLGAKVVLPIGPQCQAILAPYLEAARGDRPIFNPRATRPNKRYGRRYTSSSYQHAIKRAAERAGVEHWYPHQLRHARGELVRAAMGVEASQAVLAHATLDATQIYTSRQLSLAIEAAQRLG